MDFTTEKRIIGKKKFIKFKNSNRDNFYKLLKKTYIGKGVEASIYKGEYSLNNSSITIKIVELKKLQKGKIQLLDYTVKKFFDIRNTNLIFKEHPSLIELISYKLINQLITQKICPNFSFNYFSTITENKFKNIGRIIFYNEYINFGNLKDFLNQIKTTNEILFNILFQIMIGIIAIQKYFNMIHTDLHSMNILVQIVKPGGYWIYKLNNNKYYLPNLGFVLLLHDFGFSHIPKKLYINWHHKKIRHHKIYDLIDIIKIFLNNNLSREFKKVIEVCFVNELSNIYYNKSMIDKFHTIFFKGKCENVLLNNNYSKIPQNSFIIEEYNLDKKFDKTKIQDNYKDLVIG